MTKEEKREYKRNYYKTHKERIKKQGIEWRKAHHDEIIKYMQKYNSEHKKIFRNKYNSRRFYGSRDIKEIISSYYRKGFTRFISLLGYFTILKSPDESLRRSIMTKLGIGTIDEKEAIYLSGQTLTKEDLDLINYHANQYRGNVS